MGLRESGIGLLSGPEAGTDCVGHMIRAITDADPTATVLKVDGIGAYDHVLRAAMLGRLVNMADLRDASN